jgi:hypothetical protein
MVGRLDLSPKGDRRFFAQSSNDRAMPALVIADMSLAARYEEHIQTV